MEREGRREKVMGKNREKEIFVFGFSDFQIPNIYSCDFFEIKFRFCIF